MNLQKIIGRHFPDSVAAYTAKDTILYALGVGFGSEPLDARHLRFVYEENLVAAPMFANVLGYAGFWWREPQYGIDWRKMLHAEQRLILHAALPAEGRMIVRHNVMGLRDRGAQAGAFIHMRKTLSSESTGQEICSVVTTTLLRGDGGCGDVGEAPVALEELPAGEPDTAIEVQTLEISALIYRLSGAPNPLHVDPVVARQAGFERPILHGLCTKGFVGYALLKTYCDLEPSRLKSMAVRFSRPAIPGERIRIEFWRISQNLIRFRAVVPSRDEVVIDRGTAEIA